MTHFISEISFCRILIGFLVLLPFIMEKKSYAQVGSETIANTREPAQIESSKKSISQFDVELDRVDILGVNVFPSPVIEAALEISPGDHLERMKVVRTEENLQSLYLAHGYEEVSIRSRLVRKRGQDKNFETVLEFQVTEGRPIRVVSVDVIFESNQDRISVKDWAQKHSKIMAGMTLLPGDVLDQSKIAEGKRAIQDLLVSEEYVGAKIEDVRITKKSPTVELTEKVKPNEVAKWVGVEYHVDIGDKVIFGFRGNTVFTKGYLDALIDEQRVVGLGKDYVGVIKSRLEDEYRAAGYARVEITPYTIEGLSKQARRVTYMIKEGPLVRISSLEFDGNIIFNSNQLQDQFFKKASAFVKNKVYVEKDVQKGAELLIEWLKENGYLSSKVITISTNYVPKPRTQIANSSVKLLIYLYEGDQTLVQSINFTGVRLLSSEEIRKTLRLQEGKPLNLFALGEGIENLKRIYRNQGYLNFRIANEGMEGLVEYRQENHFANIHLNIEEGMQYLTGHVEIEGLEKTKEFVVRRQIPFKEGKVLSEMLLVDTERKLRRMGIFSNVEIRTNDDPRNPGTKNIRIVVREADRGILTWGPGLRNDLGVRLFGQLAYTNLWGLDHTALVNVTTNRRFRLYHFAEGQFQFAYIWPWFGLPDLTFRPTLSGGRTQYINFAADTLTLASTWDKVLATNPNLTATFSYTLETIHQFQAIESVNNDQLLIGSITPRLTLDMRDNPLTPTRGLFSTVWLDFASPYLGSKPDIGYYRIQFRADYHVPVTRDIGWYLSFRTGFEKNIAPPENESGPQGTSIPLIRQFALGGIGSLRGYQEQELNYQDMTIKNSLSYVNYRTQLDLPLAGALKFGIFADAATLLRDSYSFGGLRYGTGFGFHYQTPVGPVNFDWGFKIDPPKNSDAYVIHFSVGVI